MKHINSKWSALAIVVVGMLALAGCFPSVEASEERSATFPVTGSLTLNVDASNGHIEVRGQEGIGEVQVHARLSARAPTLEEAREQLSLIDLEMTQLGNEVTLRHDSNIDLVNMFNRSEGISFEVVVPTNAELSLNTQNGHIEIRSTTGNVIAHTSNGHILARDVLGDLDLGTSNGKIEATGALGAFNARTSNGAIYYEGRLEGSAHSARTSNGAITFEIPADLELSIDADVGNGRISSNLPLSGDFSGKHWSATLNNPTATLELSTSNGSIRIR